MIKYLVTTDQSLYESGLSSQPRKGNIGGHGPKKVYDDKVDNSKEKLSREKSLSYDFQARLEGISSLEYIPALMMIPIKSTNIPGWS